MKLKQIRKVYHNQKNTVEALKGIDLELNELGLIVLLGSSGCGKTTLLNIIAQKDVDFEGELSEVGNSVYLTQDVQLMELMSVFDNLMIVDSDATRITELLSQYGLIEHKNKKVKKLSGGQKKRVQFLRALLMKPSLLLCDEPTASLDHENATLLMKDLKAISNEIQVLVVTHDIALANEYASRIIKMEQGLIVEDKKIEKGQLAGTTGKMDKKTFKDSLSLVVKQVFSRPLEALFMVVLLVAVSFSMYFTLNLFQTTSQQADINTVFNNGENIVLSLPNESHRDQLRSHFYIEYDPIPYTDVQRILDEYPQIMGVDFYFNNSIYDPEFQLIDYKIRRDFTIFAPFEIKGAWMSEGVPFLDGNMPLMPPALLFDDLSETLTLHDASYYIRDNPTSFFLLVNNFEQLPLLYGDYPVKPTEIVIDRAIADKLLNQTGFESYEQLINQTIQMGIVSNKTNQRFRTEGENVYSEFNLSICGVSSVKNEFMQMGFMNGDMQNNPIYANYIIDFDRVNFDYVRFIIEPGSDYEAIVSQLNEEYPMKYSQFVKFEGKGIGDSQVFYRNPSTFMVFGVGAVGIMIALIGVTYLFMRKRMIKENGVVNDIGYGVINTRLIKGSGYFVITAILSLGVFIPVITKMNEMAQKMMYKEFMNYQPLFIVLITLVSVGILLLVESLFSIKKK